MPEMFTPSELAQIRGKQDMVPQGTQENSTTGYETGDANLRAVMITMTIILSSTLVILLASRGIFSYLEARENRVKNNLPSKLYAQKMIPPGPHLYPSPLLGANKLPWDEMSDERAKDESQINGYTYNPQTKVASIPIADAMKQEAAQDATPGDGDNITPARLNVPGKIAQRNIPSSGVTNEGKPSFSSLQPTAQLYPYSARWERMDEKLTAESSGGRDLGPSADEKPAGQAR